MRKTLLVALCSLYVAGCTPPPGEGPDPPPVDAPPPPPPDASAPYMCAVEQFDPDVFANEIMPILDGEANHNDPGAIFVGCTRSECHGRNRGSNGLLLDPNDTAENNLGRFACFVDMTNPSASQVLVCPLGDSNCITAPHPGADVFFGDDDLNYQRVLLYLQDSAAEATRADSLL